MLRGAGDHFCGGLRHRGAQRRDRCPARGGQHPAPPATRPTGSSRCCCPRRRPVVCRVQGWAAGIGLHLVAGLRLRRRRRRRPALGALSPSGASPPTAVGPGCCRAGSARSGPARCSCWARRFRGPRRPTGAWCTGPLPAAELDEVVDDAGQPAGRRRPTVTLGLTKWLLHAGSTCARWPSSCRTRPWPWSCPRGARTSVRAWPPSCEKRPPELLRVDDRGAATRGDRRPSRRWTGPRTRRRGAARPVRAWLDERCARRMAGGRAARWAGRSAHGADPGRLRGVVPGVRRVGPGRADLAGRHTAGWT